MEFKKELKEKHTTEREFHDALAKTIKPDQINIKGLFESATAPETKFAYASLGDIEGKKILDLGCGTGEASLYFALHGARVYSVDISPAMINLLISISRQKKLSEKITARVMFAEKLLFKNKFFDLIYGRGVLHHVDAQLAMDEVYRVLKPGGIAAFVEPLEHNPLINAYRLIARDVRTPNETPLNYDKLRRVTKANFHSLIHKEFHLTTLLIFLWYFFFERINPNKERYWDKLINDSKRKEKVFSFLYRIDEKLFRWFPYLRRHAWYTVLVFEKQKPSILRLRRPV